MDSMRVLLVDNYDSFTANIAHYLGDATGIPPTVVRNDEITWAAIQAEDYDAIVISPGPGTPERDSDMGVSNDVLRHASVPVFGVCLGHQALVHVHGGKVVHAPSPMHGRISPVEHDGSALFAQIPSPFDVVRYHSLMAQEPLPDGLRVTARTPDGLVMAIEHTHRPMWGVQFHPESIQTDFGRQIIHNFIELARQHQQRKRRGAHREPIAAPASASIAERPLWRIQSRRIDSGIDPQSVFLAQFAHSDAAFWLDSSAVRPGYSRFSFMGDGNDATARTLAHTVGANALSGNRVDLETERAAVFGTIREGLQVQLTGGGRLPFDFVGGWVGYFGYELKALTEVGGPHRARQPDLLLRFITRFLAYDHLDGTWHAVATGPEARAAEDAAWLDEIELALHGTPEASADIDADIDMPHAGSDACDVEFVPELDREAYRDRIARCFAQINDGETYEVCLTNRLRARADVDATTLYRHLRTVNPAPYAAFLRCGSFDVLSSSPERFLHLSPNGVAEIKPIKGTRRRSKDAAEDQAIVQELRTCEKDRAENLMIVDLTRNDLARVCEVGSVWVPKLMQVESYATVHQLVSTVRAQMRAGQDVVDLLHATFPGGSMTGAPKRRTLEIIDGLETSARGVYSGAIGFLSLNGAADLSMVIRTLVKHGDELELGVGGAIIALSDADDEFEEIMVKARALMRAVAGCVTGDADRWSIPGECRGRDTIAGAQATGSVHHGG
jgi:para-aminobenzoate synthetase